MSKYIVVIERNKEHLPLTIKAESILEAKGKALNGCYKFDRIIGVEKLESYKNKMSKYIKVASMSSGRVKSSKRYLLG